jgi:predicted acyltransferase (DUF342 family)
LIYITKKEFLNKLIIPDNTIMEANSIIVENGIIIGGHSNIFYGLISDFVIIGEKVKVNGNITTKSDAKIDMWSEIDGDVEIKENAYFGDFVTIKGRLKVSGNLDIGDDVRINEGFEAKGNITIRNPIPMMVFLFLYINEMLRLGKDEEVEKALEDLIEDEEEEEIEKNYKSMEIQDAIFENKIMIIPYESKISNDLISVPDHAIIGNDCRLIGNIRAKSFDMESNNILYGSIKTKQNLTIGMKNSIHGNIESKKEIYIGEKSHILGNINAQFVTIHETARVDGKIHATKGTVFERISVVK